MNTKLLALALIVIATIIGYSFLSDKDLPKVPESAQTTPKPVTPSLATETKLCYLREFTGALPAGSNPDIDYLELQLDPVTRAATGIYNWIPSGKDSGRGQLYGAYETDTIATATNKTESLLFKGKYLFMIEGSEEGREMYVKFNALGAQIGKGELTGDGSAELKYKDPSNLTYPDTLPRINCAVVKPEYTTVPMRGSGGES